MRTPAASADRSALCSTMPKEAAASATATSTIDGRDEIEQRGDKRRPAEHLMIDRAR